MNEKPIKLDRRWRISREWCGYPRRRHVVRFCDDYVANAPTMEEARGIAQAHARDHYASLGIAPPA